MNPHHTARLRIAVLLLVGLLVQTTLAADLRVLDVAPDFMVLLAICAGLAGGPEAGAWVGFFAGLATDLFLTATPLGLSALTYCIVGAAAGTLRASVLPEVRIVTPLLALAGTAAAVILFVAFGELLGQSQLLGGGRSWLIRVTAVEALWAAVLSLPINWLYARAARGSVGVERIGSAARAKERALL